MCFGECLCFVVSLWSLVGGVEVQSFGEDCWGFRGGNYYFEYQISMDVLL